MGTEYISSVPGILKLATVVIAFLVIGLAGYGLNNAAIYSCSNDDDLCKFKLDYRLHCETAKKDEKKLKTCSWDWSPKMLVAVTVICLIISIAGIVLYVLTEVQPILKTVDFIYHLCGGILLILFGLCVIVYGAKAIDQWDCKDSETESDKDICVKLRAKLSKPQVFIASGLFAFINGCVYIGVGVLVFKAQK